MLFNSHLRSLADKCSPEAFGKLYISIMPVLSRYSTTINIHLNEFKIGLPRSNSDFLNSLFICLLWLMSSQRMDWPTALYNAIVILEARSSFYPPRSTNLSSWAAGARSWNGKNFSSNKVGNSKRNRNDYHWCWRLARVRRGWVADAKHQATFGGSIQRPGRISPTSWMDFSNTRRKIRSCRWRSSSDPSNLRLLFAR